MIVVTAGTSEYTHIVKAQARKCRDFGYQHLVFDLGGLGIGEPYHVEREDLEPSFNGDSLPPATFKAALVERALAKLDQSWEVACWLDADCIPLQPFVPGPPTEWDVAVTLRPTPEVGACGISSMDFLNSGVVWFRNSFSGRALCAEWGALSKAEHTDQGALNNVVAPRFNRQDWIDHVGQGLLTKDGVLVLVLDAMQWNRWHLPPEADTRIIHLKRGIRHLAPHYCLL